MRTFTISCVALLACLAQAQPARAQTPTPGLDVEVTVVGHAGAVAGSPSDHFLTFGAAVALPGVALKPGTYVFRFIAPGVLQVLNERQSMSYGMFQTSQALRSDATNGYVVRLRRILNDAPARLTALFLPWETTGYELWYPQTATEPVGQLAMK